MAKPSLKVTTPDLCLGGDDTVKDGPVVGLDGASVGGISSACLPGILCPQSVHTSPRSDHKSCGLERVLRRAEDLDG